MTSIWLSSRSRLTCNNRLTSNSASWYMVVQMKTRGGISEWDSQLVPEQERKTKEKSQKTREQKRTKKKVNVIARLTWLRRKSSTSFILFKLLCNRNLRRLYFFFSFLFSFRVSAVFLVHNQSSFIYFCFCVRYYVKWFCYFACDR